MPITDTVTIDGTIALRERCIVYAIDALRGRTAVARTDDVVEIAKAIETYIGGQKENEPPSDSRKTT